ncbi:MAG TPA: response regulator [Acetobacteraceae bacterium]|nr:response regulator [Acetobacteraceae bacterium]
MDRDNASIVAIVDDDDEVRDVLRGLLESEGHNVETFKSGEDFLANTRLETIACLIVDQRMPGMSGVALISTLAQRGVTIPSLLITGAPDPEVARAAETLGAMTVLQKPLPSRELLRFVEFSVG